MYGSVPHQRQRWKCIPTVREPYRFADVLPRQRARAHVCLECETVLEPWEGQQTAWFADAIWAEYAPLPTEFGHDADHPLMVALRTAFISPGAWTAFEQQAADQARHAGGFKDLLSWLHRNGPLVTTQLATRSHRGPNSVGPVEQTLQVVRRRIGDRAGAFGNRTRTNRRLQLMTLE